MTAGCDVFIRDKEILDRIGCQGKWEFAELDETADEADFEGIPDIEMCADEDEEFDNSNCDADFDKESDGYEGVEGYMRGVLMKKEKKPTDKYSRCVGIYSADGMYKMEAKRGVTAYLGNDGLARCVALPQCKMMNSTVLDGYAKRKVYIGEMEPTVKEYSGDFGKSGLRGKKAVAWLASKGFEVQGTHIPFDLWCVFGVVMGKALRVWRGAAKRDMGNMPSWMYVDIREVFECLNPGNRWEDLSEPSRKDWVRRIHNSFERMRGTGMAWDMPDKSGGRIASWSYGMLESTFVYRRVSESDEKDCLKEWGDVYEPCGFKVHLKNNRIFLFCWRHKVNSPSVVQIRRYEHDSKKVMGVKGSNRCFHMIWASWLMQYRNYWTKRGLKFNTCVLEWSQKEMLKGFEDSVFEIRHLSSDEMLKIMTYHTLEYADAHGGKRPAHAESVYMVRRCVVGWTMPKNLSGESVLVKVKGDNDSKYGRGKNMSLDELDLDKVPDEVKFTIERMEEINRENAKHVVTLDGWKRIDTNESAIFNCVTDICGKSSILEGLYGRCYSMRNGIQTLKKVDRRRVKIDGNPTKEVDYCSLHLMILYAKNGIGFSGFHDAYDTGLWYRGTGLTKDEARNACKMLVLRMLNAKNKNHAIYSFRNEWNRQHGIPLDQRIPWLLKLYDSILMTHAKIAHEFCANKGVELMNIDGRLIREVCHRLVRERICCLAVHDSVLVESHNAYRAMCIMKEEFSKMFKGCEITVKY